MKIEQHINSLKKSINIASNEDYASGINYAVKTIEVSTKLMKERIDEILSDNRLAYKTATVFSNAPLALVQMQMEVELHTLQKVLGVEPTNIKKLRNEK